MDIEMRLLFLVFVAACSWFGSAQAQIDIHGPKSDLLFTLQGTVYDQQTLQPLRGAKINVVRGDGISFSALTDSLGGFAFVGDRDRYIEEGASYKITVEKECYLIVKDQTTTVGLTESTTLLKEYYLSKIIDCGASHWAPVVQFAKSSSILSTGADTVLTEIAIVMQENPNITLEIRASIDVTEREELGQSRGEAVLSYLVSHGVDPRRLSVLNRGKKSPVITAEHIDRMTDPKEREAAHALNRRVDFKVLRTDWHP